MKFLQSVVRWALVGSVVGLTVATLVAPSVIHFWRAPRGAADAMCQCRELIDTATNDLILAQMLGTVGGFVVFGVVGWVVERWKAKRKGAAAASAPAPNKP